MTVPDGVLLTIAEVSAGLIGLFLVGMVFYIQTGFRRLERSRSVVEPYFRSSTRIVLIVYSIPLAISLTLVALPLVWSQLLFWLIVSGLITANVSTVGALGPVMKATRSRLLLYNEVVGTAGVVAIIVMTLVAGGFTPDREELVPAIVLALGLGFLSTCVLVLTLFDIAEFERTEAHVKEISKPPERRRWLHRWSQIDESSNSRSEPASASDETGSSPDQGTDITGEPSGPSPSP